MKRERPKAEATGNPGLQDSPLVRGMKALGSIWAAAFLLGSTLCLGNSALSGVPFGRGSTLFLNVQFPLIPKKTSNPYCTANVYQEEAHVYCHL